MNDETKTIWTSLGRFEIGMGTLVFVYATLSPMIGRFFPISDRRFFFFSKPTSSPSPRRRFNCSNSRVSGFVLIIWVGAQFLYFVSVRLLPYIV